MPTNIEWSVTDASLVVIKLNIHRIHFVALAQLD